MPDPPGDTDVLLDVDALKMREDATHMPAEEHAVYTVKSMASAESPDPRSQWESALEEIADLMKSNPTIPDVDMHGVSMEDQQGLEAYAAPAYPLKHCAFTDCDWHGET